MGMKEALKAAAKEVASGIADGMTDIISQGADEAAKALYTGSGFSPQVDMPSMEAPEAPQPVTNLSPEVKAEAVEAAQPLMGDQYYVTNEPVNAPDSASMYVSAAPDIGPTQGEAPDMGGYFSQSLDDRLNAAAAIPQQCDDRDLSR